MKDGNNRGKSTQSRPDISSAPIEADTPGVREDAQWQIGILCLLAVQQTIYAIFRWCVLLPRRVSHQEFWQRVTGRHGSVPIEVVQVLYLRQQSGACEPNIQGRVNEFWERVSGRHGTVPIQEVSEHLYVEQSGVGELDIQQAVNEFWQRESGRCGAVPLQEVAEDLYAGQSRRRDVDIRQRVNELWQRGSGRRGAVPIEEDVKFSVEEVAEDLYVEQQSGVCELNIQRRVNEFWHRGSGRCGVVPIQEVSEDLYARQQHRRGVVPVEEDLKLSVEETQMN